MEPQVAAKLAGLHYVSDSMAGIRRKGTAPHFRYTDPQGHVLRNAETLKRIRSLVIPPAWRDVWITPDPDGHLQAVGRDARGRKQYRYHPGWREVRDSTKYHRMVTFGHVLPKIRRRVEADLRRPSLGREKVLATIVRLLEITLIRVGNDEYAKQNGSYGLITLRDRHVHIAGGAIDFYFRGKSGIRRRLSINDRRLAGIVKRCRDIPGYELFQYRDEQGERHSAGSADVNDYLREIAGDDFTAKDFRTWHGTVMAALELASRYPFRSQTQARKNIVDAVKSVSGRLGNTPAVCRKCYVHPAVFDAYAARTLEVCAETTKAMRGLSREETAVLCFLEKASKPAARKPSLLQSLEKSLRWKGAA